MDSDLTGKWHMIFSAEGANVLQFVSRSFPNFTFSIVINIGVEGLDVNTDVIDTSTRLFPPVGRTTIVMSIYSDKSSIRQEFSKSLSVFVLG